jgi:pimeloyl-ACP methyl ester carboxylesterase
MRAALTLALLSCLCAGAVAGPNKSAYGPELEGLTYPYPVMRFNFRSQAQQFNMAYMDVPAQGGSGHTVVLLHGANFCSASWERSISRLILAGYRVIAPDQLGFCKSAKPLNYQYSLQQLAANTHELLLALKIDKVVLVGHSFGGMLAMRFAMLYPEQLEELVLICPLGLEDWKAKGVPYRTVDQRYAREIKTTVDSLKQYELESYYDGNWQPEYQHWVDVLAGQYVGSGGERYAWNRALVADMLFTQPVIYELERIHTPTVLFLGGRDKAVPFHEDAPPEVAQHLGEYAELGAHAVQRMANAKLVAFDDLGHVPQIEAPDRFNDALVQALEQPPVATPPPPPSPPEQHPRKPSKRRAATPPTPSP